MARILVIHDFRPVVVNTNDTYVPEAFLKILKLAPGDK